MFPPGFGYKCLHKRDCVERCPTFCDQSDFAETCLFLRADLGTTALFEVVRHSRSGAISEAISSYPEKESQKSGSTAITAD